MNIKIIDADGEWFCNKGSYSFIDPETNVLYEPALTVKVKSTAWLKMQEACIQKVADPLAAPEPAAPSKDAPNKDAEPDKQEAPKGLAAALSKG